MTSKRLAPGGLAAALLLTAVPALAQRAQDNATEEAEDAFGTSVGNERVGIYSPFDVRGFSPVDAGNVRMEGLYFDQQANPTGRLIAGTTVRVGLSAQSYPFPAPTGIADHTLRKAGDDARISPVLGITPYGGTFAEVDAQLPIVDGRLGIAAGAGLYRDELNYGGDPHYFAVAIMPRWRPADGIEILPFWSRIRYSDEEAQMLVKPAGDFLPPKISRRNFYGQEWTTNRGESFNYGVLGSAPLGGWTVRAGVFRSVNEREQGFANLFLNLQPDGRADEFVLAQPDAKFASTSGELRVSRSFDEGDRRHTVHLALRGREQRRRYGGEVFEALGPTVIGVRDPVAKPAFAFGERSFDRIEQKTAGLGYELRWRGVGELSIGVQKTDYRKETDTPTGALPISEDDPWLINGTAAAYLGESLVAYASYARGLEESPRPPENAVNSSDAPPAIRTEQVDGGLRWAVTERLSAVAGLFEVSKPFYDLDPANRFAQQGTVRHRGVELSLAGQLATRLSPVATIERNSFASLDWRIPESPFSVDAVFESTGERVANQANTLVIPPRSVLSLGGRYRFAIAGKPATVRAQVGNIFNNYGFGATGGGLLVYNLPRRFAISLAADL